MRRLSACVLLVACAAGWAVAQRSPKRQPEQMTFGMETPIRAPRGVPAYVLRQMAEAGDEVKPESVEGSLVNLNNDGKPDLIVQGDGGANVTGYWVFHSVGGRWVLVLHVRAFGLSVDKTFTNGYRDISASAMTAVTIMGATYNFDLEKYRPRECWNQSIEEYERSKGKRVNYTKCTE